MNSEGKKNVLCCDDEKSLCDLLAEELEFAGYNIFKAYSGNEAIEILRNNHIDLVISDVRMPNGDGYSLLKDVKALNANLPIVVMITGYSDIPEQKLIDAGAKIVLPKPIKFNYLLDTIRKMTKTS